MTLSEGSATPDFTLPGTEGAVTLSALRPQQVVLYFYPKDDTPGCTVESKGFSAMLAEFKKCGTLVYGISRDSVESHRKFCAKHLLGLPLLSDEDGKVCEAYGVWVEKSMYGKQYMGIERTTFLIDGEGRISRMWKKVKVENHVNEVLAAATKE